MLRSPKFSVVLLVSACLISTAAVAGDGKLLLGRPATPEEVKAWDIDIRPDGQGLPVGKGTVSDGEQIYVEQCAVCHGDFGEGVDRWPVLAGGKGTLTSDNPVKTVGSYWPYLSTVYDYIKRAMPFGNAQSLSDDDIYALTAYILYLNDVVSDESFELSDKNFDSIKLPNVENFVSDGRPDTPTLSTKEPCMSDCKAEVKITGKARVLDVTPDEGAAQPRID
jgi:cytochrome c